MKSISYRTSRYRTGTFAGTEMLVFHCGLNSGRTRVILTIPERIPDFDW